MPPRSFWRVPAPRVTVRCQRGPLGPSSGQLCVPFVCVHCSDGRIPVTSDVPGPCAGTEERPRCALPRPSPRPATWGPSLARPSQVSLPSLCMSASEGRYAKPRDAVQRSHAGVSPPTGSPVSVGSPLPNPSFLATPAPGRVPRPGWKRPAVPPGCTVSGEGGVWIMSADTGGRMAEVIY